MNRSLLLFAASAVLAATPAAAQPGPTLRPFASEHEFAVYSHALQADLERLERRLRHAPPPPPPPPPAAESVTHVQTEGVDEGGIVKVHGEHLVVLRRGRLFTVRIGGGALQPVAAVDAYAPGIDPARAWYDEMLVSGDHVVVIGYSYARGGTELGVFRIGADGSLAHRATYHLRSADYYSSTNYASRLIGSRLVFYAPVPVRGSAWAALPAMRRWDGPDSSWVGTASVQRIFRPVGTLEAEDEPTMHTVTTCDLAADDLRCESTAILGPASEEFYVSAGSVYLWTAAYDRDAATLYRMPLDGSAPTALRATGHPLDPFSFLESADGHLNVLTRRGRGWGWSRPEGSDAGLALLRVPLSSITDGSRPAPAQAYRALPVPRQPGAVENRFVGPWLLYGVGAGGGTPPPGGGPAYAVRWAGGGGVSELDLPHPVDRIEAMGGAAVLIGGDGRALHLTTVDLSRAAALAAHRYTRPGASQGETRSHGFFYRADGAEGGVLGLPVRGGGEPGYAHLRSGSAGILFLRSQGLRLQEAGELAADTAAQPEDFCAASCTDWYGNARPLFLRGRILALMGYELVEGTMADGRIREARRVSFAPRRPPADVAGEWSFTETLGSPESVQYHCASQGTMRLEQDGASVVMRYRQTGECRIERVPSRSDGEGSGRGVVSGPVLNLTVEGCRYRGLLRSADRLEGRVECRVHAPPRRELTVHGTWSAERVR